MYRLTSMTFLQKRSFSLCNTILSGHNKWSKIKEKKGNNDKQKSVIYGKANHDILLAVRSGGSADPNLNIQLAAAIKRAKEQGVPKDNIENSLARARGKDKGGESLVYEALAFNSVGLIIECLTDNTNRTIHSIREILSSHNARLAPVKFMFQRKGSVTVLVPNQPDAEKTIEELIDVALEAGAEDFEKISDSEEGIVYEFTCPADELSGLMSPFIAGGVGSRPWEFQSGELKYAPSEASGVSDESGVREKLEALLEELESNQDTSRVWTSLDS